MAPPGCETTRALLYAPGKSNLLPHDLKRLLYKIRFFILRLFFVALLLKINYTQKDGTRP
jgi:hypothetical protein